MRSGKTHNNTVNEYRSTYNKDTLCILISIINYFVTRHTCNAYYPVSCLYATPIER